MLVPNQNGRDFSTLLLLAAGTMTDVNGATHFTQQFAINGQRGVEAVFAMDGADISDPEMGGSTFTAFAARNLLIKFGGLSPVLVGPARRASAVAKGEGSKNRGMCTRL